MPEVTNRSCGTCTLCCEILKIRRGPVKKPAYVPCVHCKIGSGCTIHESRPDVCRDFSCAYLLNIDPEDRPPAEVSFVPKYRETFLGKLLIMYEGVAGSLESDYAIRMKMRYLERGFAVILDPINQSRVLYLPSGREISFALSSLAESSGYEIVVAS